MAKTKCKVSPTKPRLIGCLNCSPVPSAILKQSEQLRTDGFLRVIQQKTVHFDCGGEFKGPTAGDLAKEHCTDEGATYFLHVQTALHEEVYQWDWARHRWVLVGQGLGYA